MGERLGLDVARRLAKAVVVNGSRVRRCLRENGRARMGVVDTSQPAASASAAMALRDRSMAPLKQSDLAFAPRDPDDAPALRHVADDVLQQIEAGAVEQPRVLLRV